jgi:hypothetical protein
VFVATCEIDVFMGGASGKKCASGSPEIAMVGVRRRMFGGDDEGVG